MSYNKHTWETGETITADKLNNLENGIASSEGGGAEDTNNVFVVPIIYDVNTYDYSTEVTFSELLDASDNDKHIIGVIVDQNNGVIVSNTLTEIVHLRRPAAMAPINSFVFEYYTYYINSTSPPDATVMLIKNIITIDSSSAVSGTTTVYSMNGTIV